MTEAEAMSVVLYIAETAATFVGLWLSVTFAYLTVAYIVGGALTKFQVTAISVLYTLSASLFATSTVAYSQSFVELLRRESTIFSNISLFSMPLWHVWVGAFLSFGTILSLYFMYNVRANKKD